jgi:hypothetical protein
MINIQNKRIIKAVLIVVSFMINQIMIVGLL